MKNILFFFLFVCFSFPGFSQNILNNEKALSSTEHIAQVYQLDKLQKASVLKIQERKFYNLSEIAPLQKTNPEFYLKKKQHIAKASLASLKKILKPTQLQTFKEEQKNLAEKKSKKIAALKEQGANKTAILNAIADFDFQ